MTETHTWTCLQCASGTGSAPTEDQAVRDAHIHTRNAHTAKELTMPDKTPRRRRRFWFGWLTISAPRRAEGWK